MPAITGDLIWDTYCVPGELRHFMREGGIDYLPLTGDLKDHEVTELLACFAGDCVKHIMLLPAHLAGKLLHDLGSGNYLGIGTVYLELL
jgi:hypothetical protein